MGGRPSPSVDYAALVEQQRKEIEAKAAERIAVLESTRDREEKYLEANLEKEKQKFDQGKAERPDLAAQYDTQRKEMEDRAADFKKAINENCDRKVKSVEGGMREDLKQFEAKVQEHQAQMDKLTWETRDNPVIQEQIARENELRERQMEELRQQRERQLEQERSR